MIEIIHRATSYCTGAAWCFAQDIDRVKKKRNSAVLHNRTAWGKEKAPNLPGLWKNANVPNGRELS
jgi:hypothetical protein